MIPSSLVVGGLAAGKRVSATQSDLLFSTSAVAGISSSPALVAPSAPRFVEACAVSPTQIGVSWTLPASTGG